MTNWRHSAWLRYAALVLLCLALYLPGQSNLPPFDRDEARFAQASRQMVESGDYVDIRFQDEARHKKPIGIYWLQSASVNLTGAINSIWAYRIPSWLGAICAVLLTAAMGARLWGPRAGLLAGGLLASCLLLGVEARMAKTDAALLATIVTAQYVLARLWLERALPRWLAAVFWLAVGVGVLIKGPLVLLACGATALVLCLVARSAGWLRGLQPLWGVPLLLLVVAPWLVAITLKTHGAFWQDSVGQDLLSKAAGVQESHGGLPGYYLATFFVTFWPWSFLLLPAAVYAWHQRRVPRVQFLLAWLLPFWLLFELFPTKLLHYTLPVFPAMALLMAGLLTEGVYTPGARLRYATLALGAFLLALVALVVPFAPILAFPVAMEMSALSIAAGLLLVAAVVVAVGLRQRRPALAASLALVALVNFYAAFWGQQFPGMNGFWVSRSAAALVAPHRAACPGPVTALGYNEPSLVFYLGRETNFVTELPPPAAACRLLLVEGRQLGALNPATALGQVSGFNYSKGKPVTLYLFRQEGAQP